MEEKHLPSCKRIYNGLFNVGMNKSYFFWIDLRGSEQKQLRILDIYCGDKRRVEGRGNVPEGDNKQGYFGYL
jgi:hypothetical protein